MQRLILAALALSTAIAAKAQENNAIVTDNQGQVISAETVGNNTLQFEGAYSYFVRRIAYNANSLSDNFRSHENSGSLMLRYGFLNRFEIAAEYGGSSYHSRMEYNYEEPMVRNDSWSRYAFRLKANILKGNGLSPALAAAISYNKLGYSEQFKARLSAESALTRKLSVRLMVGYILDDGVELAAHVNYLITPKFSVYGEYFQTTYGISNPDFSWTNHNLNAGLGYNFSPNTQLNIYGAWYDDFREKRQFDSFAALSVNVSFATRLNWGQKKP